MKELQGVIFYFFIIADLVGKKCTNIVFSGILDCQFFVNLFSCSDNNSTVVGVQLPFTEGSPREA